MVDMRDWVPVRQTPRHFANEVNRVRSVQERAKMDDLNVKELKKTRRELVKMTNPLNTHEFTNILDPWVNDEVFKRNPRRLKLLHK